MSFDALLGLISLLMSAGFAVALGLSYVHRRRMSTACWLIGVGAFAVGVACQFLALFDVFHPLLYRLWYLTGAFYSAAFLGMGSIYLLGRARFAGWTMRILCWASLLVVPIVFTAPIQLEQIDRALLTGEAFPTYVRLMTPLFNVFGTVALVGVALWSAVRLARSGVDRNRASQYRLWSVSLIAVGAMAAASGSTLLRFGIPGGFYLGQLIGIALMWLGFWFGSASNRVCRPVSAMAPRGDLVGSADQR